MGKKCYFWVILQNVPNLNCELITYLISDNEFSGFVKYFHGE